MNVNKVRIKKKVKIFDKKEGYKVKKIEDNDVEVQVIGKQDVTE